MNRFINKGRKSIENEKPNRGGRKSDLSKKPIPGKENCPPNCEIEIAHRHDPKNNRKSASKDDKPENLEKSSDDEKMVYARKSSPKENPKKSTKAKKLGVGEKGPNPGQKSIDELMSEVVMSCGKFFCPEKCGKWYTNKNPIKKHLLSHRPKSEWPWVCLFCGRHFQVRLLKNCHWLRCLNTFY